MKTLSMICLLAIRCLTAAEPSTDDIARHLASCVATISETHFPPGRLLALDARGASGTDDHVFGRLHQLSTWPIVLSHTSTLINKPAKEKTDGCLQKLCHKATSYVLLTDVQYFSQQVITLHAQTYWNPRAFFLVVVTALVPRNTSHSTASAREILASLWARQVVNAVVLIPSSSSSSSSPGHVTLDVYTWFPYNEPENCASSVRTVTLLDRWSMDGDGSFFQGVNLFPQKIPKNLHGCPLRAAVIQAPPFVVKITQRTTEDSLYDGLEIQVLKTIAGVYNFTVVYHTPERQQVDEGNHIRNGTWTGVFRELIAGRANMTLGCIVPSVARFRVFDFTKYYSNNAVVWVVPKPKLAQRWRSLYNIFSPIMWLLLFIAYNIVVLVVWLLARTSQSTGSDPTTYRSLSSSYHIVLGLHLGVSTPHQPRSNRLRAFFLLVACYSLWIDTAYQSSLVGSLTRASTHKSINTIEQLLDSDLELAVYSDYERLYNSEDPRDRRLHRRIGFHCGDDIVGCLARVSAGGTALLANRALVQFHKDGRGRTPFKMFRNDVFTFFVGIVLPKGSPLLDPFNDVILRLDQAYLVPKWRLDLSKRFKAHSIKSPRYVSKKIKTSSLVGPKKLTVLHLQGSFVLLFIRCAIALIVFLAELAFKRFHQQPQPPVLVFMH